MNLNFLLDLLFPKFCLGCSWPATFLCPNCYKTIAFTTTPLCPICEKPSPLGFTHPRCKRRFTINGLFVLGSYNGVLRKMIHHLKYKNVFSLAETLVDLWITHYPQGLPNFDFIASIPLHPQRLKERGYNQAEILAKLLARRKNFNFYNHALMRVKNTASQMSIKDKKKRKENLAQAFAYTKKVDIAGKTIALVDDVSTTGATIFEATKVLKRNGAKSVWGIVLAR